MSLSADLISQFTKVTKPEENTKKETTVYGSIVKYGDDFYARIDGSDILTPISSTVDVKDGDRVSMLIKNHTAVVTGNFSKPAVNEDSQVFKGMVTFQGLSGGTTTIDGACIKTGKIKAERLELTGAITWNDLDSNTQTTITSQGGVSASYVEQQMQKILDGNGHGTFIDGNMIYSPHIVADTFRIFGKYGQNTHEMLNIYYHEGDAAEVVFSSPATAAAYFDFMRVRFSSGTTISLDTNDIVATDCQVNFNRSTVDFSGATVTGLSVVFG